MRPGLLMKIRGFLTRPAAEATLNFYVEVEIVLPGSKIKLFFGKICGGSRLPLGQAEGAKDVAFVKDPFDQSDGLRAVTSGFDMCKVTPALLGLIPQGEVVRAGPGVCRVQLRRTIGQKPTDYILQEARVAGLGKQSKLAGFKCVWSTEDGKAPGTVRTGDRHGVRLETDVPVRTIVTDAGASRGKYQWPDVASGQDRECGH